MWDTNSAKVNRKSGRVNITGQTWHHLYQYLGVFINEKKILPISYYAPPPHNKWLKIWSTILLPKQKRISQFCGVNVGQQIWQRL